MGGGVGVAVLWTFVPLEYPPEYPPPPPSYPPAIPPRRSKEWIQSETDLARKSAADQLIRTGVVLSVHKEICLVIHTASILDRVKPSRIDPIGRITTRVRVAVKCLRIERMAHERIRREPSTLAGSIHPEVRGIKAGFRIAMVEPREALFLHRPFLPPEVVQFILHWLPMAELNKSFTMAILGSPPTTIRMIPATPNSRMAVTPTRALETPMPCRKRFR